MLIEELQGLSADWRSWIVVGCMAALAAFSVIARFSCPYVRGLNTPTDEQVAEAKEHRFSAGWRFGLMMVAGIALTLVGLFMIAGGIRPALALGLMVLGIVIIQTEPARLLIRDNERVVVASRDAGAAVLDVARARLRNSHQSLVLMNVGLLAALTVGLIAF